MSRKLKYMTIPVTINRKLKRQPRQDYQAQLRVYWNYITQAYELDLMLNGKQYIKSTYETDDYEDACMSANALIKQFK